MKDLQWGDQSCFLEEQDWSCTYSIWGCAYAEVGGAVGAGKGGGLLEEAGWETGPGQQVVQKEGHVRKFPGVPVLWSREKGFGGLLICGVKV